MTRREGGMFALAVSALIMAGAGGCIFTDPSGPGPDTLAGGTIETTNGIVIMPDGRPAARIKVYLLDEKSWLANIKDGRAVTLDSAETDDTGYFRIKRDTASKVSLLAGTESYGILIRHLTADLLRKEYGGKIALRGNVAYRGRVGDGDTTARQVYLAGTPFTAHIDSNRAFHIPNVPPAKYTVVVRRVGPDLVEEFVTAGEVDLAKKDSVVLPDTLKPDTSKTVLFDDFEDRDNRTELGPINGDGYWDAHSDEHLGGNARLIQPVNAAPQNFIPAIKDGGAMGREWSLEVTYQGGDRGNDWKPFSFVHVYANLGSASNGNFAHYNLSKMDTLSFFAKGSGRLVVDLAQNQYGIPLWITAGATVTLTDQWQQFKIAAKDLEITVRQFPATPSQYRAPLIESRLPPYAQKPTTWQEMGGMVRTVELIGAGGSTFWIDDIRFHGLALDDLLK